MAKSLQLEEDGFRHQFGKRAMLQARFNYYSKCQRPDLIMGLKPHADGSGYTVILQYEVGLQNLQQGQMAYSPINSSCHPHSHGSSNGGANVHISMYCKLSFDFDFNVA
ncbi:hypothetical protein RHGRI_024803 [Rhododendron griersonianum]|uniref:Isopenicillin N synthase-like Fe(2+) 2OG dioxygenase domain-containing protein n=1 Tax=Rhododendron griersonianum TaxID=479676 RepID=A0AAV6JAV7_9ERIC|nr:hypothetical protein RHGRI_024803 [Rhododendron griersonianum]